MSAAPTRPRAPRLAATMRDKESVTPLELFFDLVFVLALTQCTQLMADEPTWEGLAKAMLILAVLWWSWSGYAWLTSLVDPEEGVVRIAMFGAMAAFLVAALCVPDAFGVGVESEVDAGIVVAAVLGMIVAAALWWLYFDVVALGARRGDPGRDRARRAGDARHPRRAAGGADRLREHPLRRAARPPAPSGHARLSGTMRRRCPSPSA